MKSNYHTVVPYVTKDGSIIRELMHPSVHGNVNQSLAEAEVPEGTTTFRHVHAVTEELYHITSGTGLMTLGDEIVAVAAGDTVCILPGTPHCIENVGAEPLRLLCCCSPAYTHEDTTLV